MVMIGNLMIGNLLRKSDLQIKSSILGCNKSAPKGKDLQKNKIKHWSIWLSYKVKLRISKIFKLTLCKISDFFFKNSIKNPLYTYTSKELGHAVIKDFV